MNARRLVSAVIAATLVFTGLVALPASASGPAAPIGMSAAADEDGTVHFQWDAAPGASGYRLEWSADAGFPSGAVTTVDTYALDYVSRWHISTDASTDVYWRVTSFGSALTVSTLGDPSPVGLVTVGTASEPQLIGPGSIDSVDQIAYPDSTVFRWVPIVGAVAYQLEYTSDTLGGGAGVTSQTVYGTQFSPSSPLARVDSNGDALTWKWRVRAQYFNGTSSASPVMYGPWSGERDFQIVWDSKPTNLLPLDNVTTVHSDLVFSWDAVAGAAKYRVSFGNSIEGSGESARILNPVTREVYTTTYVPTAQVADNTRYWQVTPLDLPRTRARRRPSSNTARSGAPRTRPRRL